MLMRLLSCLSVFALLAACSHQPPPADGDRVYSYVDAQGNLVQGHLPANKKPAADSKAEPHLYTYQDAQNNLVHGELPPAGADDSDKSYQTPEQAEEKQDELARDRFITRFDANGYLVREKIDPVAARAFREAEKDKKEYEEMAYQAARQARDRQYAETSTPVPADCCLAILPHAEKLATGKDRTLHFTGGEYGWIETDRAHPAHVYKLDAKAGRLLIRSYKNSGGYLHPWLLFLDPAGTPMLAVNELFERRYPETWFRYAFVEGTVPVPAGSAFVVVYLPYESGDRKTGMVSVTVPSLGAETDAQPAGSGELLLQALPN